MRIGRTIPPAAAPIYWTDIVSGLKGLLQGQAELDRFESELREYFGVKHCFLLSSGKAALSIILQALKDIYPTRNEVLIPAFTCYSVPSAIVRAGLKVRLCDIDTDTLDFNFDDLAKILSGSSSTGTGNNPNALDKVRTQNTDGSFPQACPVESEGHSTGAKRSSSEALLQPSASSCRLLAIVPTHLFGLLGDVERLRDLVLDPKVTIIEDAAQAMGGDWNDKKLGTFGDVSFFSLGRGKPFSSVEGGIIITNRTDIAERVENRESRVLNYGPYQLLELMLKALSLAVLDRPTLFWLPKSLPFLRLGETIYDPHFTIRKMTPFQAGLARRWRVKLGEFHGRRAENSLEWNSIPETGFTTYPLPQNGNLPAYIRYPVRVTDDKQRADLLEESDRAGLGIMPTYPDSINGIAELRESFYGQNFPMAKKIASELVTLPVHPFLSKKDRERIITVLSQISNRNLLPGSYELL